MRVSTVCYVVWCAVGCVTGFASDKINSGALQGVQRSVLFEQSNESTMDDTESGLPDDVTNRIFGEAKPLILPGSRTISGLQPSPGDEYNYDDDDDDAFDVSMMNATITEDVLNQIYKKPATPNPPGTETTYSLYSSEKGKKDINEDNDGMVDDRNAPNASRGDAPQSLSGLEIIVKYAYGVPKWEVTSSLGGDATSAQQGGERVVRLSATWTITQEQLDNIKKTFNFNPQDTAMREQRSPLNTPTMQAPLDNTPLRKGSYNALLIKLYGSPKLPASASPIKDEKDDNTLPPNGHYISEDIMSQIFEGVSHKSFKPPS